MVKLLKPMNIFFMLMGSMLFSMVILRYFSLSSNVMDLGIFITAISNSIENPALLAHGHLHPLMPIWGIFFRIFSSDVATLILLSSQTGLLLLSVVAVWRFFGWLTGFAFLIYYPLWALALFDFHFDFLAIPVLTLFFISCEKGNFRCATISALSLLLIKEPFGLVTTGCGFYFFWIAFKRGKDIDCRRISFYGLFLILVGFFWFYSATQWIIPYFSENNRGAIDLPAFSWLGNSISEMVISLIIKFPNIILEIFTNSLKLKYLFVIFGLLAFIPLISPAALIPAIPVLAISLLSKGQENYYSYANHYTAGLIVPLIISFHNGLPVARRFFCNIFGGTEYVFNRFLLAFLICGHVIFSPSPISRLFWSEKVWSYGWRSYVPTERVQMMKNAITKYIPADRSKLVVAQNTVNWAVLADRKTFLPFPLAVNQPYGVMDSSNRSLSGLLFFISSGYKEPLLLNHKFADFIVLDLKRPYFVLDKGCNWIFGKCTNKEVEDEFTMMVLKAKSKYETLYENDEFIILQKI